MIILRTLSDEFEVRTKTIRTIVPLLLMNSPSLLKRNLVLGRAGPEGRWHVLSAGRHKDEEKLFGFRAVRVVHDHAAGETGFDGLSSHDLDLKNKMV